MQPPDINDADLRRYAQACEQAAGYILAMLDDHQSDAGPVEATAYLEETLGRLDEEEILLFLQALGSMAAASANGWASDIGHKYPARVLVRSVLAGVKPST